MLSNRALIWNSASLKLVVERMMTAGLIKRMVVVVLRLYITNILDGVVSLTQKQYLMPLSAHSMANFSIFVFLFI